MQKINLYIDQGVDWSTSISINSPNTSPVDIVGSTVNGAMKSWYTSNTSYAFTCTIANSALGEITLSIPSAQTSIIPAGRYVYNIKLIDSANKVSGIVEGIVEVRPEVV